MTSQQRFALVDCNNFYVSCERLFRPDLLNKPIVVLSNNDGCVVARSAEVKALGVKMAVPVHQIKELIEQHDIHLFSSNYTLYADLSSRVMSLLTEFAPRQEIYSIDESFLDLTGVCDQNPLAYGERIRWTIGHHSGIPVCVGMAPTKTLAKLANYAAKRWRQTGGVVDLACPDRRERLMKRVPVKKIWGIGSRLSAKLNQLGVITAWDLACLPQEILRAQFSVVVARTVMELNGTSCLPLEEASAAKQQIICSRSFKQRLTTFDELAQALTQYASRASEKLRGQNSVAGSVTVSIRTGIFNPDEVQYNQAISLTLPSATQDTRVIIKAVKRLLRKIYKPGYRYQHAGIALGKIRQVNEGLQSDLFIMPGQVESSTQQTLMKSIDEINRRFPNKVSVSSSGIKPKWSYQPENLSKRYTTHWGELVQVTCL
ncbi:MAG: DNA polymerase V subunit UmuC [Gammaproteobacteria bacterium]|nr:MAG: DNA polymerase V subunit UmuC [Gammaproteobacteria bacterium]